MDMNLSKIQETVEDQGAWSAAVHGGHKESDETGQLNKNSNDRAVRDQLPIG